jgi:hypothetical protein
MLVLLVGTARILAVKAGTSIDMACLSCLVPAIRTCSYWKWIFLQTNMPWAIYSSQISIISARKRLKGRKNKVAKQTGAAKITQVPGFKALSGNIKRGRAAVEAYFRPIFIAIQNVAS